MSFEPIQIKLDVQIKSNWIGYENTKPNWIEFVDIF